MYLTDKIVEGVLQKGTMPDITISDFIQSFVKMFNLVILPTSQTDFDVMTLDEYYTTPNYYDITKYIDISNSEVKRPDINKKIIFSYNKTDLILGQKFRELNKVGYGDLEAEFDYDGSVLNIDIPFDNLLMERLSSINDGLLSNVHVGRIIDKDFAPAENKPIIFYLRGQETLSVGSYISYINDLGTLEGLTSYHNVGQENSTDTLSVTNSLNFGSELSTWNYAEQTESLYSNFWQQYIEDLYSPKRRVYTFDAVLPLELLTTIKLSDVLIISEKPFIINNMKIGLTNGKVQFELIDYLGELVGLPIDYNVFNYNITQNL